MNFPKNNLRQFIPETNKAVSGMVPKMIGFTPMAFCDFFENLNVIQTYSEKHKEYIQGIYFQGKLVGHIYLGSKYTDLQILEIVEKKMPKEYDQMLDYVKDNANISYCKYDHSHYAFVYENIIKKVPD